MRLTRFTDYSLRVLVHLGQNANDRVTINHISETYDISKNHLMKVVSNLTRSKLVQAQRGPGGGIQLNRQPEDIKLNEVIAVTEKRLREFDIENPAQIDTTSADSRLHGYLHHAMHAYLRALEDFTLADVIYSESEVLNMLPAREASVVRV